MTSCFMADWDAIGASVREIYMDDAPERLFKGPCLEMDLRKTNKRDGQLLDGLNSQIQHSLL
jgi:hypothetical protein